jgi:hypothetical protein
VDLYSGLLSDWMIFLTEEVKDDVADFTITVAATQPIHSPLKIR